MTKIFYLQWEFFYWVYFAFLGVTTDGVNVHPEILVKLKYVAPARGRQLTGVMVGKQRLIPMDTSSIVASESQDTLRVRMLPKNFPGYYTTYCEFTETVLCGFTPCFAYD